MKVSNKSEHALHAMLYVAASGDRTCSINKIAEEQSIPREYLAKIMKKLVAKGFLKSFKGIYGGYKLAKSANRISFLNIIEAMEGSFLVISCADDIHRRNKSKRRYCAAQIFWIPLQDKLKDTLSNMTLDKVISK